MHELGIAESILKTVLDEQKRLELETIEGVTVRVGALSGVLPDALQFGFEAIRIGTPLKDCQLSIEIVPISVHCSDCGNDAPVENYLFVCPACNSTKVKVVTGYELAIAYLEVQDNKDNRLTNGRAY